MSAKVGPGARRLGMDQRRAVGERFRGVEDGRQLLVLDLDQVERCLGDVRSVGHHGGHRVADEAHLVDRQDGLVAEDRPEVRAQMSVRRAVGAGQHGARPAAARARDASIRPMRACGKMLRRTRAWSMPGSSWLIV